MRRYIQFGVAIAILLASGGLLFVAISGWRETSYRHECQDHLRQVGLATSCYRGSVGEFPTHAPSSAYFPPEVCLGWHLELMPYVEQGHVEDEDQKLRPSSEHKPRLDAPRIFTCPLGPTQSDPIMPGLTHFVGMTGVGLCPAYLPSDDPHAGIFGYERHTRPQDVVDGLSQTILVAETDRNNGPWSANGPGTMRGIDPENGKYLGNGGQFGSRHHATACGLSGYVTNALFADGSVHPLRDTMPNQLFEALATMAGREACHPVNLD
jgi:prepilin-type processing-associated H-X9-DG protein